MERLQKVLAHAGVASRRKAEQLILDGRVTVNGEVVRELGTQIDPDQSKVTVDGKPVKTERKRYILLHKPSGYITTADDERGRDTVLDLVDVPQRVVPVGRLDRKTYGLLILTNDGELAYRVTHPRFEIDKEYEVELDGHLPRSVLDQIAEGVILDDGKIEVSEIHVVRNEIAGSVVRIVIHEGRNRIVRRLFERVGYPARKLTRVRIGPIQLQGIPLGNWRDMTEGEVRELIDSVQVDEFSEDKRAAARGRRPAGGSVPGERSGPQRFDDSSGRRGRPRQGGTRGNDAGSFGDRNRRPGSGGQEYRGKPRRGRS